ncbi:MAG: hypothetical protein ACRDRJ_20520, partial [Streptosporangiaceae bacterium]
MSNPDVPGPYRKDSGRTRYRSADYGSAGYGGASRAPADASRDRPAPRSGGDGPARRPRSADDYQPRGSASGGSRPGAGRG